MQKTTTTANSLNILLVSDIHNGWQQLEKLRSWYDKNPQKFDYVFALGDFDGLFPVPGETINEKNNNYENMTKILTNLEYYNAPIIYIPGNHDPIGMFTTGDLKITEKSILVQNKSLLIAENLQVVGSGGSLPSYFEKDFKFDLNFDCFPYSNEEELGKDLNAVLEKHCNPDVQTLLLTHTGPFLSSTTIIYREKEKSNLWTGTKHLDQALKEPKYNILANLHGHAHPCIGRTNIGKVQIINPGSLVALQFGILSLHKKSDTKKWIVRESRFIDLFAYE